MSNNRKRVEEEEADIGSRFTVQPERELGANWEVDLSKKLEDYLIKICSGQINDSDCPINFAEAALVVQGSVQVYSRKVEYLYNLVLHALEFLSQTRQQDQSDGAEVQPEESGSRAVSDEENDLFWGFDDIPVDAKNCLDRSSNKDAFSNHFVKPPANLVVLEGDCLDTSGDGTELESYLLATNDLYRDYILLDPCDAVTVDDFLKGDESGQVQSVPYKGSASRKSYQSPTRRSGGTAHKSSVGKNKDSHLYPSPRVDCEFEARNSNGFDTAAHDDFEDNNHEFDTGDQHPESRNSDDSDDDDPWKPLNPHEPGSLKVKPFKKAKTLRKNVANSGIRRFSVATLFPPAKLHGTISPELLQIWETQHSTPENETASQSPPLYEKLRQCLSNEGNKPFDDSSDPLDRNEGNEYDSEDADFGQPDLDMPENMCMDEDASLHQDKHDNDTAHCDANDGFDHGVQDSQASLEDLCRSHLDALLASIAETEKQTELAARVSTWKQKIEHNLEEQDSHPPFDIHEYGDSILNKLSLQEDNGDAMSFANITEGQEKHDVARAFSALLQLVNNGDVELERHRNGSELVCYTAEKPFYVRLLNTEKREKQQFRWSKKKVKTPSKKVSVKLDRGKSVKKPETPSLSSKYDSASKPSMKINVSRCTPESKRRRRSRIVEPVDLHSSG